MQPYEDEEYINKLENELSSADVLQGHVDKMAKTRGVLFPKVKENIKVAQEKQQRQYVKEKGD